MSVTWQEAIVDIKSADWRQGDVLPGPLTKRLFQQFRIGDHHQLDEDGLFILASHTCDIQNLAPAKKDKVPEPYVEAIHGTLLTASPAAGKTARFIDLALTGQGKTPYYRFEDRHRFRFSRLWLHGHAPETSITMLPDERKRFARFLAKRYDRPVFPDAFESALRPVSHGSGSETNPTIPRLLRKNSDVFSGIYFDIEPESELGDGEHYELSITALMKSADYDNHAQRREAEELLRQLAEMIQGRCHPAINLAKDSSLPSGLQDLNYYLESEGRFPLAQYRKLTRYDWDYLSPEEDDLPVPHPEP